MFLASGRVKEGSAAKTSERINRLLVEIEGIKTGDSNGSSLPSKISRRRAPIRNRAQQQRGFEIRVE